MIVDGAGNPVVFRGIGWFGFNTGYADKFSLSKALANTCLPSRTAFGPSCNSLKASGRLTFPGDISRGTDSVTRDFRTIVWRIKQLGFNGVRLPFTFAQFLAPPAATNAPCTVATEARP